MPFPAHIANLNQYPSSSSSSHSQPNPFPSANNPFLPNPSSSSDPFAANDGNVNQLSEMDMDLNAALARQLEEWTNVDFSYDDGGVGIGMGLGLLKSEGSGGNGNGDAGNGNGNGNDNGGNGNNPNGSQPNNGQPDEEEEKWETKKGKGNFFSSARKLHERLEEIPSPTDPAASNNAVAGPSAGPFNLGQNNNANGQGTHNQMQAQQSLHAGLLHHPNSQPNPGHLQGQSQQNGLPIPLDPNFIAFLQSMYNSQVASQATQQAQTVVDNQARQQGMGAVTGQAINGHGHQGTFGVAPAGAGQGGMAGLMELAAVAAGMVDPFGQRQVNHSADLGLHTATFGGAIGGLPSGRTSGTSTPIGNPNGEWNAANQPMILAPQAQIPATRGSIRRLEDVDYPQPSSSSSAGGGARAPKRVKKEKDARQERELSSASNSGSGDVRPGKNGKGKGRRESAAGGDGERPPAVSAGNGMVYAANGEIITHEEDKRRRNTEASARFRVKKKEREQALERSKQEVEERLIRLERENKGLRKENTWLKALLVNGTPQPLDDTPSPPIGSVPAVDGEDVKPSQ